MAELVGEAQFKNSVRKLESSDLAVPDTWNPIHQDLINNDVHLETSKASKTELQNHVTATKDAHPASAISYSGSGNLQATNVEEALDELDAEKAPVNHTHTAAQVGALVSIDGVSNPGGDVDLVPGAGISITTDNATKKIIIAVTGMPKTDGANTWTQRQNFAGGIQDGDGNQDVSLVYSVQHQVHTRTTVLTYTNGKLTLVEEKDGSTVVKTETLTYDGNGWLSSVVETAGGVTRTKTLNYDASGNLVSVTRS